MAPSEFHVRRATVDDLPVLRQLWQAERFNCAELKRLPASFGDRQGDWLTLQLKDEVPAASSLEQEFELFRLEQEAALAHTRRQARTIKLLALVIGLLALGLISIVLLKVAKAW